MYKAYRDTEGLFESKDDNLQYSEAASYSFYNTTAPKNWDRQKKVIISALKSARNGKNKAFQELREEIKKLPLTDIGNWSKVKSWITDKKTDQGAFPRWEMLMKYMEQAGRSDWNSWMEQRRNASYFRTQNDFYGVAFDDRERTWLKVKDILDYVDYLPEQIAEKKSNFTPSRALYEEDLLIAQKVLNERIKQQFPSEEKSVNINYSKESLGYKLIVNYNDKQWELENLPAAIDQKRNTARIEKTPSGYFVDNLTFNDLANRNAFKMNSPSNETLLRVQNRNTWKETPIVPIDVEGVQKHKMLMADMPTSWQEYTASFEKIWTDNKKDQIISLYIDINYNSEMIPSNIEVCYRPKKFTFTDYEKGLGTWSEGSKKVIFEKTYALNESDTLNINEFTELEWTLLDIPEEYKSLLKETIHFINIEELSNERLENMTKSDKDKFVQKYEKKLRNELWKLYKEMNQNKKERAFGKKDIETIVQVLKRKVIAGLLIIGG